jgi:hypothetical protein
VSLVNIYVTWLVVMNGRPRNNRIHNCGERKTASIMMATVRHIIAWAGLTKYHTAWFLLNSVYNKYIWDLYLPVETFYPRVIRHRQRLAQAVCLQFSTTSVLWKLLALWNALPSATLTVDVGPFYWWLKDDTMEALKFVLHFVLPACSHFALYTSLYIHLFWPNLLTFHVQYRIMHVFYSHWFHQASIFSTYPQVTLHTAALCTHLAMCQSSVRTSNVALQNPTVINYINNCSPSFYVEFQLL